MIKFEILNHITDFVMANENANVFIQAKNIDMSNISLPNDIKEDLKERFATGIKMCKSDNPKEFREIKIVIE